MKILLYITALLTIIPSAHCGFITVDAETSGSYTRDASNFTHASNSDSISRVTAKNQQRSYFTFNLAGITSIITAAHIEFLNPTVSGSIHLLIKKIDNDLDLVTQTIPNTDFKDHYRDLGKGTKFSTNNIDSTTISLNVIGLNEIQSSLDQLFAIGVRTRNDNSSLSHDGARLTLTTATPEPEEVLLLLLSVCLIIAFKYKKSLTLSAV